MLGNSCPTTYFNPQSSWKIAFQYTQRFKWRRETPHAQHFRVCVAVQNINKDKYLCSELQQSRPRLEWQRKGIMRESATLKAIIFKSALALPYQHHHPTVTQAHTPSPPPNPKHWKWSQAHRRQLMMDRGLCVCNTGDLFFSPPLLSF